MRALALTTKLELLRGSGTSNGRRSLYRLDRETLIPVSRLQSSGQGAVCCRGKTSHKLPVLADMLQTAVTSSEARETPTGKGGPLAIQGAPASRGFRCNSAACRGLLLSSACSV